VIVQSTILVEHGIGARRRLADIARMTSGMIGNLRLPGNSGKPNPPRGGNASAPQQFAKACEMSLEGIVSKRAGSMYQSGPSRVRRKTKNPDFVRT
jgi:hypothetical protein